uniref:Lipoprotein n=2 Tax=Pandoraea thiooxydans TaxID=445709 RepID=A0A0G3F0G9_9BURK
MLMNTLMPRFAALLLCFALLAECAPGVAGPWRATSRNSYGWQLMTPDERIEHQRHLRGLRTYDECKAYQRAHHALIAERARQAGVVLTPKAVSVCDRLRARGSLR